jgi:nucleotide-binding universal stress UspA family protein
VRGEFERRCQAAAIPGQLAAEAGPVAQTISQRGRWADLVVVSVSYPPPHRPSARLSSGMSNLLRDCPRPVLAVPRCWCQLDRALLAYDGSPKSDEALFVATYLALQWQMPLVVVTVAEHSSTAQQTLGYARDYLADHEVQATLVHSRGPAAEALLQAAEEQRSSLLIMGGYGLRPVLEVLLGSTVDRMLRTSNRPILVCR